MSENIVRTEILKREWLDFNDKILRVDDINYFELEHGDITCYFHMGMEYKTCTEVYKDRKEAMDRYIDLMAILGAQ